MRPRALVALLLVLAVAGLTPLAKASPPDPTWVAGFWDNGDYDDIVLLICATVADLPAPPAPPRATGEILARLEPAVPAKPSLAVHASAPSRAPPRA